MKRIKNLSVLLLLLAMITVSCKSDENEIEITPDDFVIALRSENDNVAITDDELNANVKFEAVGGNVFITVDAPIEWNNNIQYSGDEKDWCNVTKKGGGIVYRSR